MLYGAQLASATTYLIRATNHYDYNIFYRVFFRTLKTHFIFFFFLISRPVLKALGVALDVWLPA